MTDAFGFQLPSVQVGLEFSRHPSYILHVRQTPQVHAELKAFLEQLQRQQISIETRIVFLPDSGFEDTARLGLQWNKKEGIESALLNERTLFQFLQAVQGDRAVRIEQMPKVTLFDGQEAKVMGGDCEVKLALSAKIPDQYTVAILAGTVCVEERSESGPPVLSRIPYVSRLFRNVGWSRDTARVIVLLTPRIIREDESFEVTPLGKQIQPEDNGKFPLIASQGSK